jgi:hypothetical protein
MWRALAMPFCPECKYEYKAGVERCPDCGSPLVERLEEEHVPLRPEAPLVKIAEGIRPMVEMLRDILRERGIHSMVRIAGPAWVLEWPGGAPRAEILVRADDLEQNREFIQEEARRFGDHVIWFPSLRAVP